MKNEQIVEKVLWSNKTNDSFYGAVQRDGLAEFAESAGLDGCCDVERITSYWQNAASILDVGAGYGRVIEYLLLHQYKGSITAIERNDAFFQHLKDCFGELNNVHLVKSDLLDLTGINGQFELILFLWAGICDFPPEEQSKILTILSKLLKKGGKLIIDSLPEDIFPLHVEKKGERSYMYVHEPHKVQINLCIPSGVEMRGYAKIAGLNEISTMDYQTDVGRSRRLYILG